MYAKHFETEIHLKIKRFKYIFLDYTEADFEHFYFIQILTKHYEEITIFFNNKKMLLNIHYF